MKKLAFIPVLLVLFSCGKKTECELAPVVDNSSVEIRIDRLEDEFFTVQSVEEMIDFLNAHPILASDFLGLQQYGDTTILAQRLFDLVGNRHIDSLRNEVEEEFGDLKDIEADLQEAFARFKTFYPNAKIPRIETMITGFGSSEMYISDSLIIIGLDYYIGPDATYRPIGYPDYILNRFQKEYIAPAIILLLSNYYAAENPADRTMLADMIYYGKKYYFTKMMMPCKHDSLLIWYSGQELADVKENEDIIWASFIENKLIYETSHLTKNKFLSERPKTLEIGNKCPGRIGTWVGWEMVRSYMEENEEVTLPQLMEDLNSQEIFNKSGYRPL